MEEKETVVVTYYVCIETSIQEYNTVAMWLYQYFLKKWKENDT